MKKINGSDMRCEVKRNNTNEMDKQCEESVLYKRNVSGVKKNGCP